VVPPLRQTRTSPVRGSTIGRPGEAPTPGAIHPAATGNMEVVTEWEPVGVAGFGEASTVERTSRTPSNSRTPRAMLITRRIPDSRKGMVQKRVPFLVNNLSGGRRVSVIKDAAKACPCSAGRQACMQADSLRYITCKPIRAGSYLFAPPPRGSKAPTETHTMPNPIAPGQTDAGFLLSDAGKTSPLPALCVG